MTSFVELNGTNAVFLNISCSTYLSLVGKTDSPTRQYIVNITVVNIASIDSLVESFLVWLGGTNKLYYNKSITIFTTEIKN